MSPLDIGVALGVAFCLGGGFSGLVFQWLWRRDEAHWAALGLASSVRLGYDVVEGEPSEPI